MGVPVLSTPMEDIVRPFVTAVSPPINRVPPQVAVADPVASIAWGRAPQISVPADPRGDTIGSGEFPIEPSELLPEPFNGMTPEELADFLKGNNLDLDDILGAVGETFGLKIKLYEPDVPVDEPIYTEVSRRTTLVRVENPEDSEQFVNVERIESISFQGNGGRISLKFNNPS